MDTLSAISSPASAAGPSPLASPTGPSTAPCGPAHALANLSPRQARGAGSLTSGTTGPLSIILPGSAVLQSALASKLRAQTDLNGSILYKLTWKLRVTPSQRSIWALRASARRTLDNDCGGWPTPTTKLKAGGEYKDSEKAIARALGPHANDLRDFAHLAGWPTATTRDWKDGGSVGTVPDAGLLGRVCWRAPGTTLSGSPAQTESPGQLAPEFVCWLMGYPAVWDAFAATVTPLCRKSARNS